MADGTLNKKAIFSDGTADFVSPCEPRVYETVTVRCRVGKDEAEYVKAMVDEVPYIMHLEKSTEYFDIYAVSFPLEDHPISYYFRVETAKETLICNRQGVVSDVNPYFNFCLIPGFHTPDWAKGAVMYQIFVDRFYNGDKTNDVVDGEYTYIDEHVTQVRDWNKMPASMGVREFYGGDLQGVMDKLDYLQDLGVEVLYLNPIFVSPSNHKYDTQDYDYIDPHYGVIVKDGGDVLAADDRENAHATKYIKRVVNMKNLEASNAFFAKFVEEVHRRGMKVILDGVFNHCGSFNKWLDREKIYDKDESYEKGAFVSEDSPYHDFFQFYPDGSWPYNTHYDGWWGHDTLPKLNYEGSEDLYRYILEIGKKWVSPPYNADGWRLDVAADLGHSSEFNHQFWRDFRKAVKSANPDAIILAEHYGDASSWLQGDAWDTVMNYDAFMEPISYFVTGMEKHSDAYEPGAQGDSERFENAMRYYMTKFTGSSLYTAMNQLSNHDHSRFLTRTNHKVGRASALGVVAASEDTNIPLYKVAVLMQMTWPGAPTLYYGDEAGVCGFTDPDNRRTYPWGNADYPLVDYHRDMIMVHKCSSALRRGSFKFLKRMKNFISYGRFNEQERYVVAVNVGAETLEADVPVYLAEVADGFMVQAMLTNEKGYSIMPTKYAVKDGMMHVSLTANSGMVFKQEV